MLNRLGSIRFFLAVIDEGSVRKAASACNISQPALTRHIQSLEEELGVTLFERTSQGMTLNPFGEIVNYHTRQIQSSCADMIREVSEVRDGEKGTLRISAGPGWSYSIVPEVISRLHKISPGVEIDCSSELVSESIPELQAGNVDIVINRLDNSLEMDEDLVHENLLTINHFVFAGPNHPLRRKKILSIQDLSPYPWINFRHSVEARQTIREWFEKTGLSSPEFNVVTNSYQTCLSLLHSGSYLMVLPSTLARVAYQQGVTVLPIDEALGSFAAGLIYRPSALRLAYFKRFRSILEDVVKEKIPDSGGIQNN